MESEEIPEKLKEIPATLKRELKKQRKKLEKQQIELEEASGWERLSHQADTLLANRAKVSKGMKSIKIADVHSADVHSGADMEIVLNPKCTVDKNAELLYKKARRGKRGFDTCEQKVAETESVIEGIRELLDEVIEFQQDNLIGREKTALELIQRVEKHAFAPKGGAGPKAKNQEAKHPYRHYRIDGYNIFAGKTSRDNDQLSTRFAKPSDLWFHAVGYAGSHVIIRRTKNEPMPPQKIIDIAGGIAVFFSKAKNTSYAEVHMTEARYVRKPRKSAPGLVTAERCKTLRMSPVDPQKLFRNT